MLLATTLANLNTNEKKKRKKENSDSAKGIMDKLLSVNKLER